MPREPSITFEQVAQVASAIKAAGGKPNQRNVREQLGRGSYATIHRLLGEWNTEPNQKNLPENPLTLPPALHRALMEFLNQEILAAQTRVSTELADSKLAANDLANENERLIEAIAELQAQNDTLQASNAALSGQIAQLQNDLSQSRAEINTERSASEQARTEIARLTLKLDAVKPIEKELERLKSDTATQAQQLNLALRDHAVAQSKFEYEQNARLSLETAIAALQAEVQVLRDAAKTDHKQIMALQLEKQSAEMNLANATRHIQHLEQQQKPVSTPYSNPALKGESS